MLRLLPLVRDVLVVGAALVVAAGLAFVTSYNEQQQRADIYADVLLNRTDRTAEQMGRAFETMAEFAGAAACSPISLEQMRRIDLTSSLLQGVGYVVGDKLRCSSLSAFEAVPVGPADYVGSRGEAMRRNRELANAPGTGLLLVTAPTGFTVLLHPALIFSMVDRGDDLAAGLVTQSSGTTILQSQHDGLDWSRLVLPAGQVGNMVLGDKLVSWEKSGTWDYMSYAIVPFAAVIDGFFSALKLALPLGLLVGIAGALVVRRLEAGRASLPTLLKHGLKHKEVRMVYQPIVDMTTGRWVGAEALARWRRPRGEWVSPDVFVPIAEKHGLIDALTSHAIATALDDFARLIDAHRDFFVSINVSSANLARTDFADRLAVACKTRNVPHKAVHLEITEREAVNEAAQLETIRRLGDLGFAVGSDDFGIGYSNLGYLDQLNLSYIKIDRVFLANAFRGALGTEIVDYIINLGRMRGLQIIAEGVEREEQRLGLLTRGVKLGQGWLFAKPMSAVEFWVAYRVHGVEVEAAPVVETAAA